MDNWLKKRDLLLELADKYGTPLYVYDQNIVEKKINLLKQSFKDLPAEIHYAMKANENTGILKIFQENNFGVDTVSINEINRALKLGFDKEKIIFTPSCPSLNELQFAFENNLQTHIGATEYFDFIIDNYPDKSIGLRINPGNQIGGNKKIATAHYDSKFGIPLNQINIIKKYRKKGLRVNSLHIHTGSDVKSWTDLARSADVLFDLVHHFEDLEYLDFGSGFKVKYHTGDQEIDLEAYAGYIAKKLDELPYPVKVKFEPGKFLVSEAGVFLVNVNIVKQGYIKKFVGVNSGFHHLIRPMYYEAYHEIINLTNLEPATEKYDIVGVLCEEDTFAYDRALSPVSQNDILMILNGGAYAYTMTSEYNLRNKPKQVLIRKHTIDKI